MILRHVRDCVISPVVSSHITVYSRWEPLEFLQHAITRAKTAGCALLLGDILSLQEVWYLHIKAVSLSFTTFKPSEILRTTHNRFKAT